MDYALGLLILWILLFFPLGLAVHWLVLGKSARLEAVPTALVSGLAVGVVVVTALQAFGVSPGAPAIAGTFLLGSIACCVAIWRRGISWRSRALIGLAFLLLVGVICLRAAAWTGETSGPLAYGTGREPVQQVATIDAGVDDAAIVPGSAAERATRLSERRYTGFERFSAMIVAAGQRDPEDIAKEQAQENQSVSIEQATAVGGVVIEPRNLAATGWSAFTLHGLLGGLLGLLTLLPVWVFARLRGIGWIGLTVTLVFGILSPAFMLTLGLAQAAGLAAMPFAVGTIVALLIARRDRGWYALAALYASAVLVILGPAGLLPVATVAVIWFALRGRTREHLKQTAAPVSRDRPIALGALAGMFALYAAGRAIAETPALRWEPLSESLVAAITSWPFTWIGGDMLAAGPRTVADFVLWLVGPAMLAITVAYALARKEVRELALIGGILASVLIGCVIAIVDADAGRAVVEYSWLIGAPLLAIAMIRATSLARDLAGDTGTRYGGAGPLLMLSLVVLFSVAAATVSSVRMANTPRLPVPVVKGSSMVAAGDPWIGYSTANADIAVGPDGDPVDPDLLSDEVNAFAEHGLVYGDYYDAVAADPSPFASDPPSGFLDAPGLDRSGARLFLRVVPAVEAAVKEQAGKGTDVEPVATPPTPVKHIPVEGEDGPIDGVGGLLVPGTTIKGCTLESLKECAPTKPVASDSCTQRDVLAARSALDDGPPVTARPATKGARSGEDEAGTAFPVATGGTGAVPAPTDDGGATIDQGATTTDDGSDSALGTKRAVTQPFDPRQLGVACWTVEAAGTSTHLRVHLRDVGLVLSPRDATIDDARGSVERDFAAETKDNPQAQGDVLRTSTLNASALYGDEALNDTFDLSFEGQFNGGATTYLTSARDRDDRGTETVQIDSFSLGANFGNWSGVFRQRPVVGGVEIVNSSGSDLAFGRVVARPSNFLPRSCDVLVPALRGARTELQQGAILADGTDRPGLVVVVTDIEQRGDNRIVHLAVANYLQQSGLPHLVMADWVQEYREVPTLAGCLGLTKECTGVAAKVATSKLCARLTKDARLDDEVCRERTAGC